MSVAYYNKVDRVPFARNVGGGGPWNERELRILANLYPRATWPDLLAVLPGRTKRAIEIRAGNANIVRVASRKPAWTGTEQTILRRMFSTARWETICRAIPRHSQKAIDQRGHALKLQRPPRNKLKPRSRLIRALRELRRKSGQRQDALAEKIGVGKHCLCSWELGISVPRFQGLLDWVQALGCELTIVRSAEERIHDHTNC